MIALPAALAGCAHGFVLRSSIIHAHADELFPGMTMFAAIRKGDILLHHPYQSFKPVIAFIQLQAHLGRNVDAWDMDGGGSYVRPRKRNGKRIDVQSRLLTHLASNGRG